MATLDEQIAAAQLKAKEAAERARKLKARRARNLARDGREAAKVERANETRRKVLVGSFVLQQHGANVAALEVGGKRFGDWLTREDDKALFGLADGSQG